MNATEKYRILLVINDPSEAALIKKIIEKMTLFRFETTTADSLTNGFEAYFSETFHIVLLDLDQPESQGTDTIASAYDAMPNIPIIALIDKDQLEEGNKALKKGAVDLLIKGSFNEDQLLNSIQYAIGKKEMTEKLRHNKDLLFDIFNDAPIIMYLVNEKMELIKINKTGLSVLNKQEKEVVGNHSGEALGCFYADSSSDIYKNRPGCINCSINQIIEKTFRNKESVQQVQIEYIRMKEGRVEKRFLTISTSYIDMPGEPLAQVSINDITELVKAKELAEESDRLKSAFLATMSHELRTPLNAVIGFSDLLTEEENKEFLKEFATTINQSGKHLLEIIEEVFLMTELESKTIKLREDVFSVEKLLSGVYRDALELTKLNNKSDFDIHIVTHPILKQVVLRADMMRLQQLFKQIVHNAVKFTQTGEIRIGVTLRNNTPVFFVEDTGIGIEPKFKTYAFDRFVQAEHALTREFSGIGLGLTIAHKIIELMHGKIWIESEKGKGTTVYFTFPDFIINVLQPINVAEFN